VINERYAGPDEPALVRLAAAVNNQGGFRLKPLSTFHAVMATKSGQILWGLGLLVQGEVSLGEEIVLDLVDVSRLAASLGEGSLVCDTHGGGFRGISDGDFDCAWCRERAVI
jgi:hypothetical protein